MVNIFLLDNCLSKASTMDEIIPTEVMFGESDGDVALLLSLNSM